MDELVELGTALASVATVLPTALVSTEDELAESSIVEVDCAVPTDMVDRSLVAATCIDEDVDVALGGIGVVFVNEPVSELAVSDNVDVPVTGTIT